MDPAHSDTSAFARLDLPRQARTGEPEVVFGESKSPEQVAALLRELVAAGTVPAFATRCSPEHAAACPEADYDPTARLLVAAAAPVDPHLGRVVVACAGTGDLPVARETVGTLEAFGVVTALVTDIGVAGLHRVLGAHPQLAEADVCVVVAGMEGALPSVVAGLVPSPVIAVPTSVGYGAAFEGLAALLGMLSACAPGITVVNIDGGFNAGIAARRILRTGRGRPS